MDAFLTLILAVVFTQLGQPTNLLAVLALGLLVRVSATQAFFIGLVAGSIAIALAVRETQSALVLVGVAALSGTAVAVARPLPVPVVSGLAFTGGFALALNSPPQALTVKVAILEQTVICAAALTLLAATSWVRDVATDPWQRIGVRIFGSWIAASAILVLALRLAR